MSTVSLQHITVMVLMIVEMAVMSLAAVRFLYYPCTILNQLAIIININNISNFAIHVQSKNIMHIIGTVSSNITLVVLFQILQDKQKKSNACIEMLKNQSLIAPRWIIQFWMLNDHLIEERRSS